jgi:hypothetical protein
MGGDHGRGKIVMPKQLLHGADVGAALESVRGEGMAQGVSADGLRQTGTTDGYLDGFVDDAGVNVMATGDTGMRVDGDVPGGEEVVAGPHAVYGIVAQQTAALRADPLTQARIDELATKCNEGALTEAEQREYEAYVEALEFIGLLQAKARAILARLP